MLRFLAEGLLAVALLNAALFAFIYLRDPAARPGGPDTATPSVEALCADEALQPTQAPALNRLVVEAYRRGDLSCALSAAPRALAAAESAFGKTDPRTLAPRANLALLLAEDNQDAAAIPLLMESLAIAKTRPPSGEDGAALPGPDPVAEELRSLRLQLAAAQEAAGQFEEAELTYADIRKAEEDAAVLAFQVEERDSDTAAGDVPSERAPPAPAAEATRAAEREPAKATEVTVYYGTDRKWAMAGGSRVEPVKYTAERAGALGLGAVKVSIPPTHKFGHLEVPSLWRLELRADIRRHMVVTGIEPLDKAQFLGALADIFEAAGRKQAFVFVHGYNTTFEDAALRTAQMAFDMDFPGAPLFYSWPALGRLDGYDHDQTVVETAVPHLVQFLDLVARETGAETVHLIAHSMGARALTAALNELRRGGDPAAPAVFGEILLAAPDMDVDQFRLIADRVLGSGQGMTLYASANDRALRVSKRIKRGLARLGDTSGGVTVLPGMDTIDASLVDTSLIGHGYFADTRSVLNDIDSVLENGTPPESRQWLSPAKTRTGDRYWVMGVCSPERIAC